MTKFLLALCALFFVATVTGEPSRITPYFLPNTTCPPRDFHVHVLIQHQYLDTNERLAISPLKTSFIGELVKAGLLHQTEQVGLSRDTNFRLWGYFLTSTGASNRHDLYTSPTVTAQTTVVSPHTTVIAALNNILTRLPNEMTGTEQHVVVFLRHNIRSFELYTILINQLKAYGVRVISVDYAATRPDAIATGFASDPVEKNVVTTPLPPFSSILQRIRNDLGSTCVVHGRTIIHTFDGQSYRHDSIGDHVLLKVHAASPSYKGYQVQIRKSQCSNEVKKAACITGIAVSFTGSSERYSIHYLREQEDLAVIYNGNLIPTETLASQSTILVRRIEPDVGFHVDLPGPSSETFIGSVEFYLDYNRDPLITIPGAQEYWSRSVGLCGTFDSCAENDWIASDMSVHDLPSETIPSWRVHGGGSLFEWEEYSSDSDPVSFTLRQPLYDANWKSQIAKKSEGTVISTGVSLMEDYVQYALCEEFCQTGYSSVAGINAESDEACLNLCDQQAIDIYGLHNLNVTGSRQDDVRPPVTVETSSRGTVGAVYFPIGGKYTFEITSSEYCCEADKPNNITVEVSCSNEFEINAGDDQTINFGPFPFPEVQLSASIKGAADNKVMVSWKVVSVPQFAPQASLDYPHSLTPRLKTGGVGIYELEVVGFDGCWVSIDRINITVGCLDLPISRSQIDSSNRWSYYHQCPQIGVDSPTIHAEINVTLKNTLDSNHVYQVLNPLLWRTATQISVEAYENNSDVTVNVSDTSSPSTVTPLRSVDGLIRNEGTNYITETITNQSTRTVREFISGTNNMYVTECRVQATSASGSLRTTFNMVGTANYPKEANIPTWVPENLRKTVMATSPFYFGRCAGTYRVNTTLQSVVNCGTKTDEFELENTCRADWQGPLSKPLSPCFPIDFNYQTTGVSRPGYYWNGARWVEGSHTEQVPTGFAYTLDGSDSSDRLSRTLRYYWTLLSSPNVSDSIYANSNSAQPITSTAASSQVYNTYVEGTYSYEIAVTNECKVDREQVDVHTQCKSLTASITCPPATFNFDHVNNTLNFPAISVSRTSGGIDVESSIPLRWILKVQNIEQPFYFTPIQPEDLPLGIPMSNVLSKICTVKGCQNQFQIAAEVTDRCKTLKTNWCPITTNCQNTMSLPMYQVQKTSYCVPNPTLNACTPDEVNFTSVVENSNPDATKTFSWLVVRPTGSTYTSPQANFTFNPITLGTYNVTLSYDDRCQYLTSQMEQFEVKCADNIITPYIVMKNPGSSQITYGETFLASSELSNCGTFRNITFDFYHNPTWRLADSQNNTVATHTGIMFTYTPPAYGTYTLYLTVQDGCKSATDSVTLVVNCPRTLIAKAAADQATVKWHGNKFPMFSLTGKDDASPPANYSQVSSYRWYFIDTPTRSLFRGIDNYVMTIIDTVQVTEIPNQITNLGGVSPYWAVFTNYTWKETIYTKAIKKTLTYTELIPSALSKPYYGACFRPDVAGMYKVRLEMNQACGQQSTNDIILKAECNTQPTINPSVPTEAHMYTPIDLTAGATDPDNDDMSYEWTLFSCTSTATYSEELLNRRSSKATWVPTSTGKYCMKLEVSDGCSNVTSTFEIDVVCPENVHSIEEQNFKAKLTGTGVEHVRIELEESTIETEKREGRKETRSYEWTLVDYQSDF